MKNPNSKTKLRAVLKAAIWGAVLFVGIDLIEVIASHFGGLGYDLFLVIVMTLNIPSLAVRHFLGMENMAFGQSLAFYLTVNVLFGAFIFAVIAAFRQFVMKGGDKTKI
jgi:hypothetical protein